MGLWRPSLFGTINGNDASESGEVSNPMTQECGRGTPVKLGLARSPPKVRKSP